MKTLLLTASAALLLARAAASADATKAVELTAEQAASFPVVVAERAEEPIRVDVLGQVLDPVPFVQASRAAGLARSALAIAERERTRIEALARSDHNASTRDVEAARLAAERAQADLADAEAGAIALWGREPLAQAAAGLIDRLAQGEASIARLEVAAGVALPSAPTSVAVRAPALGGASRSARILGAAPNVDPALRGRAYLVALDTDPLPIGAALAAELGFADAMRRGAWVPEGAVVWQAGASAVFVAAGERAFLRQAVELAPARRAGFFVATGIEPGTRVVAVGAQQLLSAELGGGEVGE